MKNLSKKFALAILIAVSYSTAHAVDQAIQADRQNIESACVADSATAGCGTEKVGKGLLKCLHAYKKANKGFKFAPSCKSAMAQLRNDKKSGK
jgi:hypothetical protein